MQPEEHVLWGELQKAAMDKDQAQFAQICSTYTDLIQKNFPVWRNVPARVRDDEQAVNDYGRTLFSIANYFNIDLGRPELLKILTGKDEPGNPFNQLEKALAIADGLKEKGAYSEAINYLFSFLDETSNLKGTAVYQINAMCFGRVGELFYLLGEYDEALNYNNYALGACFKYGDVQGIFTYFENLYHIYYSTGNYAEAAEWSNAACNFAKENNSKKEVAKWLIHKAQAQTAMIKGR